jgi:MoxR-like ATPase
MNRESRMIASMAKKQSRREDIAGNIPPVVSSLLDGLESVIRGKRQFLEYLLACLFAGGHVLIEDVPGLGKTTVAKSLAQLIAQDRGKKSVSSGASSLPDLLPYDITGVDIFDPEKREFVFSPGPVFANILLADEINRTSPKVQSALLEVMAENQVTVGKMSYAMDPFFFVVATQNPVETAGTYPLPIAQLDRFFMRLSPGYPDAAAELAIVMEDPSRTRLPGLAAVCSKRDILDARSAVYEVFCDERLLKAAVGITHRTREHRGIELGVSPRGSLMLIQAARSLAFVKGRNYCIDQDILDCSPLVLAHRLKLKDVKLSPLSLCREVALAELEKIAY